MKHVKPTTTLTEKEACLFWLKVEKSPDPDGCWIWTGAKSQKGYGLFTASGRQQKAHRLAFKLSGGKTTPEQPIVCHGPCHNTSCVNPAHLSAGSCKKNIQDKERDGTKIVGIKNHQAKLDDDKVRSIRNRYADGTVPAHELASEYNVDPSIILDVVHRRTWAHVDPDQPIKLPDKFHFRSRHGESNSSAKITENDVRIIRNMRATSNITLRELGQMFGLSTTNIGDIVNRKVWAHV